MRALINGGELDGVRILPKARLDEMMAPAKATPAGYLGLVFFGSKIAGHDSIGHEGDTMTFFSELKIFPEQGIGVFVSRDGIGEINGSEADTGSRDGDRAAFSAQGAGSGQRQRRRLPGDADVAGIYQSSRRAEIVFHAAELVVVGDRSSRSTAPATQDRIRRLWPFGEGRELKPLNGICTRPGKRAPRFRRRFRLRSPIWSSRHFVQRVPWSLDARWIVPAFVASMAVILLTLLAWPVAALWRYWRKRRWSQDSGDRRRNLAVRMVLLVDAGRHRCSRRFFSS